MKDQVTLQDLVHLRNLKITREVLEELISEGDLTAEDCKRLDELDEEIGSHEESLRLALDNQDY